MLIFISTTVMATQTIGIPFALYLCTTNELSVGPNLLAFVCVTAYRAGCYFVGVFVRCIRDMHHSRPCSSLPFYPILWGMGCLLAYSRLQYILLKTWLCGDFRNWRYHGLVNSNMAWTSQHRISGSFILSLDHNFYSWQQLALCCVWLWR